MAEHSSFIRSKSFRRTGRSLIKRYDDCVSSFDTLILENRDSRYNCYLIVYTWFEVLKMISGPQDPVYDNLRNNLMKDVSDKYERHLGISFSEVSVMMQPFFENVRSRKRRSFKVNTWINEAGPVNFNHLLLENQRIVLAAHDKKRRAVPSQKIRQI